MSFVLVIWILIRVSPSLLAAGQTGPLTERLSKTVVFDDVAVSPDGSRVAWVQGSAGTKSAVVHTASTSPGSLGSPGLPVRTTTGEDMLDSSPVWSPDSKKLAFFSTGQETNSTRLWRVAADGTDPPQYTALNGYAARPRWSHDGGQIAFLYIEGTGGGGPLLAAPARTGVIDTEIHNQRIAVFDLKSEKVRQVSPEDLHIYDFDWSPDDRAFAVTGASGPGDNNWWIAKLLVIDLEKGQASAIYKPSLQIAIPRWSPDGKAIAFIEGLMSDEGFHGGDLYTISGQGRELVNRTKGHRGSVSSLFWVAPDRILLTESVGGGSAISELSLESNFLRSLWQGDEGMYAYGNFPNFSLAADGIFSAAVRSSYERPPEVWVGPVGKWRQLTALNRAQTPEWGRAESLEWTNGGFNIQGWILPPKQVRPDVRHPMVVMIHGGPANVAQPEWPGKFALDAILASQGYYVFLPNPRGSYGRGEDFVRANVKDFGGGDLRDVLAGLDVAIARYPIDPERLGVTGWSYGGYMTMWTVTQTSRFRAAVAGAGIANWQSYYGQNLIDQWMIPFFGASVYEDPAVYAKSSPILFIRNVKTPTLLMVGEHDAECPAPQSYEFWHGLRTLRVPTQLVVYAGEGHMFMNPTNRVDSQDRTVAWFDKYLK